MIASVFLGFFCSIIALVGMKCTKIGGSDESKARIVCFAGVIFILSGLCSLSSCSLYAHRVTSEFFDPMYIAQKYELGAALFIGWAGSLLCILGGLVFCFSISDSFTSSSSHPAYAYRGTASATHTPSNTRGQPKLMSQRPPPESSSSFRVHHFDKNAYV
ncbi:hypothetical protein DPEC_G00045610 [Dallia pectoralis]|uniref:Uncharacterized protein n=1 Tax=Dallia pectoralis TaxID=75939 RepID=A0ACC2HAF8_DALPE|nr:hypothetical protein DPEC_G00045610 [Dallia pectoralis]